MVRIKKINGRLYFLLDRLPKEGDDFFEICRTTRSSYNNIVFKCISVTENYILSKDVNHPFQEDCKPILFSFKYKFL